MQFAVQKYKILSGNSSMNWNRLKEMLKWVLIGLFGVNSI